MRNHNCANVGSLKEQNNLFTQLQQQYNNSTGLHSYMHVCTKFHCNMYIHDTCFFKFAENRFKEPSSVFDVRVGGRDVISEKTSQFYVC